MGDFGIVSSIGAFIIWIFKGYKIPYKEIRYGDYPCFGIGICTIILTIFLVFYLPRWFV
ncbi:MAG: hypothetical protein Tsb004_30400 [Allomuricauda sp.]